MIQNSKIGNLPNLQNNNICNTTKQNATFQNMQISQNQKLDNFESNKKQRISTGAKIGIGAAVVVGATVLADVILTKGRHIKNLLGIVRKTENKNKVDDFLATTLDDAIASVKRDIKSIKERAIKNGTNIEESSILLKGDTKDLSNIYDVSKEAPSISGFGRGRSGAWCDLWFENDNITRGIPRAISEDYVSTGSIASLSGKNNLLKNQTLNKMDVIFESGDKSVTLREFNHAGKKYLHLNDNNWEIMIPSLSEAQSPVQKDLIKAVENGFSIKHLDGSRVNHSSLLEEIHEFANKTV